MSEDKEWPVGLTRDAGWQIGVRRTLPIDARFSWDWITSPEGIALWLGVGGEIRWEEGARYRLADGTSGEVRIYQPATHLRITRQPKSYPRPAVVQVRVIEKGQRAVMAFHEEHLPSAEQREERRQHYQRVFSMIKKDLKGTGEG